MVQARVLVVAAALLLAGGACGEQEGARELLLYRVKIGNPPVADLVVVGESGGNERVVAGDSKRTVRPAYFTGGIWSPDGRRLAFTGDRDKDIGGPSDVYVVDADGSNLRRLWLSGTSADPAWSPDGRRLAFTAGQGLTPNSDVYVVDADGSNLRRLTRTDESGGPAWSPDGLTIAFARASPGGRGPRPSSTVWVIDADGRNQHRLVSAVLGTTTLPAAWSPDGSMLVCVRVRPVPPEGSVDGRSADRL